MNKLGQCCSSAFIIDFKQAPAYRATTKEKNNLNKKTTELHLKFVKNNL